MDKVWSNSRQQPQTILIHLYTQELSAVMNEKCDHTGVMNKEGDLFDNDCDECSIAIPFADDASL